MKNKIFGYVRVSSKEQNEDRQLIAFKEFGIDESKVVSLCQWKQDAVSMDTPLNDEEKNTVGDLIADPND